MQLSGYQEQIMLCRALKELDEELAKHNIAPFTLNVVGGFALLLQEIRKNVDNYTDIDYVGKDLSPEVKDIMEIIGYKHHFGPDWINNDILLSGASLQDLELATGKLHFHKKMELEVITVNALDKKDLLRLKLIAIDTSLLGTEFGGEFTRTKDFKDILLLMEDLHYRMSDLNQFKPYLLGNDTLKLVNMYRRMSIQERDTQIIEEIKKNVVQLDEFYLNL